jgi:cyclase
VVTTFATLAAAMSGSHIVDLSSDVSNHADGPFGTSMEILEPEPGAKFFCETVLPRLAPHAVGRLQPDDFPASAFLRHELVRASVHAGSHIDAPGHYGPAANGSDTALINDAPLTAFLQPAMRVDVSDVEERVITLRHVDVAARVERDLGADGGIALIHTGGGKGVGGDVVEAFIDAGISVVGTDSEGFDGPFAPMIDDYLACRNQDVLWPAHMLGRRRPYYQLERLTNLGALPDAGFFVIALPVLVDGATAAWTRAIALVPGN